MHHHAVAYPGFEGGTSVPQVAVQNSFQERTKTKEIHQEQYKTFNI